MLYTKKVREMFYVLVKGTERTVALCDNKKDAVWIASNYHEACIIRSSFF